MRKALLHAASLAAVLASSSVASAAPPAEVIPGWNGEALLGVGFHDGVGPGIGVRAGYTLPNPNIYIGGMFTYHFGSDNTNVYYLGAEGGYDIAAGPVLVRPYLGLGPVWAHTSVAFGGPGISYSNTASNLGFWPGCTVAYPLNEQFFIGGDARILVVNDFNTFNLFAMGGMNFF